MDYQETTKLIETVAEAWGIPPMLLHRIAVVESNMNTWATRYEPAYRYHHHMAAAHLRTTPETEAIHQRTSWGLCQIMGASARDFKYREALPMLCDPAINLRIACRILADLRDDDKQTPRTWRWTLNAYNHGTGWEFVNPRWEREGYIEQYQSVLEQLGE